MDKWTQYDPQTAAINAAKQVANRGQKVTVDQVIASAQVHATMAVVEQLERIANALESKAGTR